jgi:hypothetical protein
MVSMSVTSTLSVISRVSRRGDSRDVSRAWTTSRTGLWSSSGSASRWTLTRVPVRNVTLPNMAVERLTLA